MRFPVHTPKPLLAFPSGLSRKGERVKGEQDKGLTRGQTVEALRERFERGKQIGRKHISVSKWGDHAIQVQVDANVVCCARAVRGEG
jgi:hypothetical protein